MSAFDRFFGGKAQEETTSAPQQVEQSNTQVSGTPVTGMQDIMSFLAGMESRIMEGVEQRINERVGVADAPQVSAPVRSAAPQQNTGDEWVAIGNHKGTLTQHQNSRIASAAGFANLELGGYKQFVANGQLNVGLIEQRRTELKGTGVTPPKKNVASNKRPATKSKPDSNATAIERLAAAEPKRFGKLTSFLPSNERHAHWSGTVKLNDGTTLNITDFPYNLAELQGEYIPRTAKVLLSAYFSSAMTDDDKRKGMSGGTGGVRDRFSNALALALNAKSNGDYAHAMSGHRNSDEWLSKARAALNEDGIAHM